MKKKKNIIIRGKCRGSNVTMSVSKGFLQHISKEMKEEAIARRRGKEIPREEYCLINILKRGGTIKKL